MSLGSNKQSTAASTHNDENCPFFTTLPPELRDMIYGHIWDGILERRCAAHHISFITINCIGGAQGSCRRMRREYRTVLTLQPIELQLHVSEPRGFIAYHDSQDPFPGWESQVTCLKMHYQHGRPLNDMDRPLNDACFKMLHAAVQFPNLRLIEAHYHIYLQDFRRGSLQDPLEGVMQWDSLVYVAADLPQYITFRSYFLLASLLLSPLPLHHTRHPDRAADVADTERSGTSKEWQVPQNYKIEYSVTTAPDTMPDEQKYNGFDLETWKVWDSPQWNGSKKWRREKRRLSRRLE